LSDVQGVMSTDTEASVLSESLKVSVSFRREMAGSSDGECRGLLRQGEKVRGVSMYVLPRTFPAQSIARLGLLYTKSSFGFNVRLLKISNHVVRCCPGINTGVKQSRVFVCIKCHFVYEVYHSTGISKSLSLPKFSNPYIRPLRLDQQAGASHLLGLIKTHDSKNGRSNISKDTVGLLEAVALGSVGHDKGNLVQGVRGLGSVLLVQHLLSVTVVGRDEEGVTALLALLVDLANGLVGLGASNDGGVVDTGVANHSLSATAMALILGSLS
ncbi:hypothetical protein KCV07_g538, partial [Aureobasidium melanogenum]